MIPDLVDDDRTKKMPSGWRIVEPASTATASAGITFMVPDKQRVALEAEQTALRRYALAKENDTLAMWDGTIARYCKARIRTGQVIRGLWKRPNKGRYSHNVKVST